MYQLILLPLALDQDIGKKSAALARKLCAKDGKIIALHVLDSVPRYVRYYVDSEDQQNIEEESVKSAKISMAKRIGDENDAEVVVLSGHPGRVIVDYANELGADCIVIGSHKPGLKDFFLGSTAARVVQYAQCAVHVIR